MVVTMLEARVEEDQADLLVGQFRAAGGPFRLSSSNRSPFTMPMVTYGES